ncbi:MAG: glycosyltransferase, partial [Opitutaceae bacterium]
YEERLDDAGVAMLFAQSRFTLLPSLAEGCGLPALESLWSGVPVLCSDLPALVETAAGGGCRTTRAGDSEALRAAMRELLADGDAITRLTQEATTRPLPTWADTAAAVLAAFE